MNIPSHQFDLCLVISRLLVQVGTERSESLTLPQRSWIICSSEWPLNLFAFGRHLVSTISGHSDWVRCAVPSDDGRIVASCSNDQVRSDYLQYPPELILIYTSDCASEWYLNRGTENGIPWSRQYRGSRCLCTCQCLSGHTWTHGSSGMSRSHYSEIDLWNLWIRL